MKTKILGLVTVALLAGPLAATATTIDFNTPVGCTASYSSSGVTFSSTTTGDNVSTSLYGNSPNGTLGLVSCGSTSLSTLRAQFGSLYSGTVSVDMGDFNQDKDILFLSLYDAANNLLNTVSSSIDDTFSGMVTLSVSGIGIDYAIFGGVGVQGSSVYSDNFTFNSAVPEPGTLALLGLGLFGLGMSQRRKA